MKITSKMVDHAIWLDKTKTELYISFEPCNHVNKYDLITFKINRKLGGVPYIYKYHSFTNFMDEMKKAKMIYLGHLDELDLEAFIAEKI